MAHAIITGVPPYDGEYDLNEDLPWNTREWRWVRQVSGYMPATIDEGYQGRNPDLYIAITVIAMCRSGRIGKDEGPRVAEVLAEVPWDGAKITLRGSEVPDELPLEQTTTPAPFSQNEPDAKPSSSSGTPNSSGPSLRNGSDQSDATRRVTSLLRSGTS